LASYNVVTPVADLFGTKGQAFLAEVVPSQLRPAARRVVTDNLALIVQLDARIQALLADLELTPEQAELVQLLQTVPGVGRVTALTIVAEIGEMRRFPRAKSLCNWAGLTPRVRKSDAMVRHGRISKQGSPYLRAALVRAATVASRCSPRWSAVHDRLVPRCGRVGAKVAVARRLLTVIYHMWTRGQPYYEDYPPAGEPEFLQGAVTPLL
jgi:transposase